MRHNPVLVSAVVEEISAVVDEINAVVEKISAVERFSGNERHWNRPENII